MSVEAFLTIPKMTFALRTFAEKLIQYVQYIQGFVLVQYTTVVINIFSVQDATLVVSSIQSQCQQLFLFGILLLWQNYSLIMHYEDMSGSAL